MNDKTILAINELEKYFWVKRPSLIEPQNTIINPFQAQMFREIFNGSGNRMVFDVAERQIGVTTALCALSLHKALVEHKSVLYCVIDENNVEQVLEKLNIMRENATTESQLPESLTVTSDLESAHFDSYDYVIFDNWLWFRGEHGYKALDYMRERSLRMFESGPTPLLICYNTTLPEKYYGIVKEN